LHIFYSAAPRALTMLGTSLRAAPVR
jgi:hypothetical protein